MTYIYGTSLAVQWSRLRASTAGGMDSIPGQGTKILHDAWCSQNKPTHRAKSEVKLLEFLVPRLHGLNLMTKLKRSCSSEGQGCIRYHAKCPQIGYVTKSAFSWSHLWACQPCQNLDQLLILVANTQPLSQNTGTHPLAVSGL